MLKLFFYINKIFIINIIILYIFLYSLEVFLQFDYGSLYKETIYFYKKKISKKLKEDVVLSFAPYKLINTNSDIFPLAGIPNKVTILCGDGSKFYYYKSDKLGFNNKNFSKINDAIIIGDSYIHGNCLDQSFNLINNINYNGIKAVGLGMMGNGPLIEYATFKEYELFFDYKYLIWIFTPDSDYYDLSNEINNKILKKYINNENYSQKLLINKEKSISRINEYLNLKKDRPIREFSRKYHLDLNIIRNLLEKILNKKHLYNISNIPNEKNTLLIKNIFFETNKFLENKNKKLLVVFNANYPELMFPKNNNNLKKKKLIENNLIELKKYFIENSINFFDFNEFVKDKYDYENIEKIFKKTNVGEGWNHYTSYGNAALAKLISKILN